MVTALNPAENYPTAYIRAADVFHLAVVTENGGSFNNTWVKVDEEVIVAVMDGLS
jgi:hypothetical protein